MTDLRHDCSAVISVELAVLAGLVLLPLTLGALDAGELVMARARLDQALHAALFYGYSTQGKATASEAQNAALAGYGGGTPPTVTPVIAPYCIVPAAGYPQGSTPPSPSNGSCANNTQVIETYLTVTVSSSVTLPFTVPWVTPTVTFNVSAKARIS